MPMKRAGFTFEVFQHAKIAPRLEPRLPSRFHRIARSSHIGFCSRGSQRFIF